MLDIEAFSWKKNDQEIRSERHVWKRNNTYGARGVKLYLEIINVTKSDEGVYECVGHKSGVQSTKALFLETGDSPLIILFAIFTWHQAILSELPEQCNFVKSNHRSISKHINIFLYALGNTVIVIFILVILSFKSLYRKVKKRRSKFADRGLQNLFVLGAVA